MKARKHDPLAGKRRVVAMKKVKSANTATKTPAHDPTAPRASAPLVTVPFHGGDLFAVAGEYADDGDRLIPLRPFCDRLGLTIAPQLVKLKETKWAVVSKIDTTGSDGKTYEMACLPLRAIPMWLATMSPKKVAPDARAMLIAFQKEAADALYRHFRSRMAPVGPGLAKTSVTDVLELKATVERLTREYAALQSGMADLRRQMVSGQGDGLVGERDARAYITGPLNMLAMQVAPLSGKSKRSVLHRLDHEVRKAAEHPKGDRGNAWSHLPAVNFGLARRAIFNLQAKYKPEIDAYERKVTGERQLKLVKG